MADAQTTVPVQTTAEPPHEATEEATPSLVGTLGRWRRALREIAASARLPFTGGDDPDLPAEQADKLRAQMRACLEARGGEVLARAQAATIATAYLGLSGTGRARFFALLATEFGVDQDAVEAAITGYQAADDEAERLHAERVLRRALVTPGMRLLAKFNALPGGMKLLVEMRAHLLALNSDEPALRALDHDFRHLLATWFDVGFLERQRLTWDSPASLLEKIIEYEAVHEIRSWTDLRHRLHGDRRCYPFFHPSLPEEPLIFVQVALVEGLAGQIGPLLDEASPSLDPKRADSAIFYSITSTLYGLRGISFGNFLIKQVVDDLAHDLPNLRQFATLSPMPGLLAWLDQHEFDRLGQEERDQLGALADDVEHLRARLAGDEWLADDALGRVLEPLLMRAAARYLIARDGEGLPIDSVARFHLGNGARIERVNWLADRSPRRLQQSAGLMVNYLYDPPEIEHNHAAFAGQQTITVAPEFNDLLKGATSELTDRVRVSRRAGGLGRIIRRS
jgi:malonyl-CoA decarboxylase